MGDEQQAASESENQQDQRYARSKTTADVHHPSGQESKFRKKFETDFDRQTKVKNQKKLLKWILMLSPPMLRMQMKSQQK